MADAIVAEYMVIYDDDGNPMPHLALYRMSPLVAAWRRFIFRLNPCCRRPWRLWYWTGLCELWDREASREEFSLIPVPLEFADEHFDWNWKGNE